MQCLAKSIHLACWSSCEKGHISTRKLISKVIRIVISAPLFYKSNFIYKYPPVLLAMYTGISTPLILQETSILRKCNSHTLTVLQEKQCCHVPQRCSKTSQSQILSFSSLRQKWQLRNKFTANCKQGPNNDRIYARGSLAAKRGIYTSAHAGILETHQIYSFQIP